MRDARTYISGSSALKIVERPCLEVFDGGMAEEGAPRAQHPLRGVARCALAAALAALAVAAAILAADGYRQASVSATLDASPQEIVLVRPGDSLWSIAAAAGSDEVGTGELVSWIRERNGLESPELKVGQRVVVPVLGE